MYNKTLKSIMMLIIGACLMNACVGSFSLFNKLAKWNKNATNSKFLNELIFILISPAYAVCTVADVFVLNTIEFWSGSNPVAANVGKTQNVMGSDGRMYAVTTLKDGYEIKDNEGKVVNFVFDEKEKTWAVEQDGTRTVLLKMKDKDTAEIYLKDGKKADIALDEQGLFEAKMAVSDGVFFAGR